MTPNDPLLLQELRRDEGVSYVQYLDTMGIPTCGVGHNLKAHPLPSSWSFPLSDEQVDGLLSADLLMTISGLDAHLGWWRTLTCARQRVLVNMAFNLGVAGLLGFKNTLAAIQRGHYEQAASGMMASKWAQQVGARADRLAVMMRVG
jgi:lysozyme